MKTDNSDDEDFEQNISTDRFSLDIRCSNRNEFLSPEENSFSIPQDKTEESLALKNDHSKEASPSTIPNQQTQKEEIIIEASENKFCPIQYNKKSIRFRHSIIGYLNNYWEYSQIYQNHWSEFKEIQELLNKVLLNVGKLEEKNQIKSFKSMIKAQFPMIHLYTDEYYHSILFYAIKVSEVSANAPTNRMGVSYPLLRILDIESDHLCAEYPSKRRFTGTLYRGEYWNWEKLEQHKLFHNTLPVLLREYSTENTLTSTTTSEIVALRFMKKPKPKCDQKLFKCFLIIRVFTINQTLLKNFREVFPEGNVLEDVVVDISEFSAYPDEREYLLRENSVNQNCGFKKFIFHECRENSNEPSFNVHICLVNARLLHSFNDSRDSKICGNVFDKIINFTLLTGIVAQYGTITQPNVKLEEDILRYEADIHSYFHKFHCYFPYLRNVESRDSGEILSIARERVWNNMVLVRYFAVKLSDELGERRGEMVRTLERSLNNLKVINSSTSQEVMERVVENAIHSLLTILRSTDSVDGESFREVVMEMMRGLEMKKQMVESREEVNCEGLLEDLMKRMNSLIMDGKRSQEIHKIPDMFQALLDLHEDFKIYDDNKSNAFESLKKLNELFSGNESKSISPKEPSFSENKTESLEGPALDDLDKKLKDIGKFVQDHFEDTPRIRYELMDQGIDSILLSDPETFRIHLQQCRSYFGCIEEFERYCHTISSRLMFAMFVFCLVNIKAVLHWGKMNWVIM